MYLHIFLIVLSFVIVIDVLGFWWEIKKVLAHFLKVKPENIKDIKPFSCSTCLGWWFSLLYLIIIGQLGFVTVFYALVMSSLAPLMLDFYNMIFDLIQGFILLLGKLSRNLEN